MLWVWNLILFPCGILIMMFPVEFGHDVSEFNFDHDVSELNEFDHDVSEFNFDHVSEWNLVMIFQSWILIMMFPSRILIVMFQSWILIMFQSWILIMMFQSGIWSRFRVEFWSCFPCGILIMSQSGILIMMLQSGIWSRCFRVIMTFQSGILQAISQAKIAFFPWLIIVTYHIPLSPMRLWSLLHIAIPSSLMCLHNLETQCMQHMYSHLCAHYLIQDSTSFKTVLGGSINKYCTVNYHNICSRAHTFFIFLYTLFTRKHRM